MAVDAQIAGAWVKLRGYPVRPGVYYGKKTWVFVTKPNKTTEIEHEIPDPATQPAEWIDAFLRSGRAIKIDPCHDHHLHIDFGGREYIEYLGWDQLGAALEAAIREWEAQP